MCLYKMTLKGRSEQLSLASSGHPLLLHQTVPNAAYKGMKDPALFVIIGREVKH